SGNVLQIGDAMNWRSMSQRIQMAGTLAPFIGLALMLILPFVFRQAGDDRQLMLLRNAEVQAAVDAMPYRLGDWVGEEVAVPTSAVDILRPNAILSRRFKQLSGTVSIHLLVVHCSDARDMQGHYPPICYPSHGWIMSDSTVDNSTFQADIMGEIVDLRIYNFRQLDELGGEKSLRVFNYFLLPNGTTTIDLKVLKRLVERSGFSMEGVAQVQLVMSGEIKAKESQEVVEDLLNAASGLLIELGQRMRTQG
ncbi:MAG: exosortase-associated EpsI family protein, partial [Planctomycetota bacterium]|nr:exosortase-associated EpsI family protein [Planctomycetota bacterium]